MSNLINRREAIDAICKHFNYDENDDFVYWNREHVLRVLRDLPPAQPDGEYISQQAVTESDLIDWYINSVDESEPVWTEEHIYELFNDFYLIPKEDQ